MSAGGNRTAEEPSPPWGNVSLQRPTPWKTADQSPPALMSATAPRTRPPAASAHVPRHRVAAIHAASTAGPAADQSLRPFPPAFWPLMPRAIPARANHSRLPRPYSASTAAPSGTNPHPHITRGRSSLPRAGGHSADSDGVVNAVPSRWLSQDTRGVAANQHADFIRGRLPGRPEEDG